MRVLAVSLPLPRDLKRTALILFPLLMVLMLVIQPASAIEIPDTGSSAFIQTTGPGAGLNIGDFYTSAAGENGSHEIHIFVPCAWPAATPITFALYDPESSGPEPVPPSPSAVDELHGGSDTTFTLAAPGGAVVGPVTFTPVSPTNGLWVELATVLPTGTFGCGIYVLTTTTTGSDENGWRLRVNSDPDCTVSPGTCTGISVLHSALMGDNNGKDDADGIPGTGDEIFIGLSRISYQHATNSCQDFFFFVDGLTSPIHLNNFDMDFPAGGNPLISVTYFPPSGVGIPGVPSGSASWNDAPAPGTTRAGDVVPVTAADAGWWRGHVCITAGNQYIFEALQGDPVFFKQPLTPKLTIAKTDGRTTVSAAGQDTTYTITYRNIGNGAAITPVITDDLPAGATFVSCTGGCAGTGPVTWNFATVPAPPTAGNTGSVTLTVHLPAAAAGTTHTNSVSIAYTDLLGNKYPNETATDIDTVGAVVPTSVPVAAAGSPGSSIALVDPVITKSVQPPFALPGQAVNYSIIISNPGSTPYTGVATQDTMPSQVEILSASATSGQVSVNGQTISFSQAVLNGGSSVTITINARVRANAQVPYVLTNQACVTTDQHSTPICAQALLTSAGQLPATGQSPLAAWRLPLLLGIIAMFLFGAIVVRRKRQI